MNNENFNGVDPNANSPLMQLNQEPVSVEQPMVPQENPVNPVEPSPMKPKKPIGIFVLVGVLLVGVGFALGFFVPKLFDKKEDTKLEENKEIKAEAEKEVEPVPVEPVAPAEEPEEPEKEEPETTEPKTEEKDSKIQRSNVVKESSQEIKLNGVAYKLETVYYKNGKSLLKDVYFNGVNVVKESTLWVKPDSKKIDSLIADDISYTKNNVSTLNDTKSKDQYLVYYNKNQFEWGGGEDVDWFENEIDVHVINKEGKVLYERWTYVSVHGEWLVIKDKNDVLDRENYVNECDEDVDEDFEEFCNGFILYNGSDNTEVDMNKGTNVEFKKDHFYAYESGYYGYVVKTKFNYSGDYKYYFENGVLKKTKLNSSNGLIMGAGES